MPTLRSVVFRFEDITAFSSALDSARGSFALPEGENVSDGEWVLAIFEIGSRRRATAAAARGVCAAGDPHLTFERRDWDRLLAFAAVRSEHMRAARPLGSSSSRIPASPLSPPPAPLSEIPPSSVLESSRIFGARVLLVEQDEDARERVRAMLDDIGLRVEVVTSAAEAEERMRGEPFDALVLDFNVAGASALDFVRDLRKDPAKAPLPVLFLSDRPSSRDVVDAFASGVDDFLPKPFRAPELGARIFGLLRRARLARAGYSGGNRA